jgi:transposase
MPGLIATPCSIWLVVAPVDMRRGVDGLSLYVQEVLGESPCAGSAFLFRNARGNRLKVLVWDGAGVWLCQRRLHQGRFAWPKPGEPRCLVTEAQWEWLVAGVDWQRLSASPPTGWRF